MLSEDGRLIKANNAFTAFTTIPDYVWQVVADHIPPRLCVLHL